MKSKYLSVYYDIMSQILDGYYPSDTYLPSENQLMHTYKVSRETVRHTLQILEYNGFIEKVKGKGSKIIFDQFLQLNYLNVSAFYHMNAETHEKITTKVIVFDVVTAGDYPSVMQRLKLSESDQLFKIVRRRVLGARTIVLDTDFFIYSMMPSLTKEIAEDSVYTYITNRLGRIMHEHNIEIHFSPMSNLDKEIFGNIEPPFLANVQIEAYMSGHTPIHVRKSKYLPYHFKFTHSCK